MQTPPDNTFKAALEEGREQRGVFLCLGSEPMAEIAGRAGFDFCLIDGEHAPYDPVAMRQQLLVLQATGMPSMVRVPMAQDWIFKQVLDIGAQTIMVPMVDSAGAARAAVAACRYPPDGVRGMGGRTMRAGAYGGMPSYPATANAQIAVIAQIETRAGLDAIEEIAQVDGIDALFIGPADLGADLGYRDALDDPALWTSVADAVRRIVAAGAPAGVFTPMARLAEMRDAGATLLAVGSDSALATEAFRALARESAP